MTSRRLTTAERHEHILKRVSTESGVDYQSLALKLKVSVMTIRRDIRELSRLGYLKVTRGGATAQLTHAQDLILNPRILDQNLEKTEIAKYATSLIGFGETVFLGSGSTCALFAQFLPVDEQILVLTPSLPHAVLLASRGIKVIILGGTVATEDVAASGVIASDSLNRFSPNQAIIGCAGISSKSGISEYHQEIADINRLAIQKAEITTVLTDPSKLGLNASFRVCDLKMVKNVVTSKNGAQALKSSLGTKLKILFPKD
jgi:DeoR/GlpR family transcriptional regulator of sugar metabolism